MSVLTLNGIPVLSGTLRMPRKGTWVAELAVDSSSPITGRVTIANFDGTLSLVGTVERGNVFVDTLHVRVVGGAGGLEKTIGANAYRALPLKTPLADILAAGGETLSQKSDSSVLGTVLSNWVRRSTTVSLALHALLEQVDASFRVLPDGTLWVGKDTWPYAPVTSYEVLDESPSEDWMLLGVDAPRLLPGTTFEERRVSLVVHTIDDEGVRSEVWFEREGEGSRLLESFRRLVRKAFSRIDYLALYPAKVVRQNGDGTLELKPDTTKLPGLSKVPIRCGLPGTKIKVASGSRVLLGFEGGEPTRPVATLWEEPGMTEVAIGGNRAVARQSDTVITSIPPTFTFQALITPTAVFAPTPGTPNPCTVTVVVAPIPLSGTIITASGKLKTD